MYRDFFAFLKPSGITSPSVVDRKDSVVSTSFRVHTNYELASELSSLPCLLTSVGVLFSLSIHIIQYNQSIGQVLLLAFSLRRGDGVGTKQRDTHSIAYKNHSLFRLSGPIFLQSHTVLIIPQSTSTCTP